jgi:hypothetical protein
MAAPGKSPEYYGQEGKFRSLAQFRELIRQNVRQGLLDIMLMSASMTEQLAIKERLFENTHVTPAARANDTTDIWAVMGGSYIKEPSRPFRTATIDHILCGKVDCDPGQPFTGADLGLYSVTFNNQLETDYESLEAYKEFRIEAERKGFRHFLEVFNPNACGDLCPSDVGRFVNDCIARCLAGVVGKGKPLFLKIAYNGPAAMEQLAAYDRSIVVGILGGSAGTTFDAFHQLAEAKKYGARVALYGRMINNAESQTLFIQHLRWVADGEIANAAEAVKSYHAGLQTAGLKPFRPIEEDLKQTRRYESYGQTTTSARVDGGKPAVKPDTKPAVAPGPGTPASGTPDFSKMTPAEKIAWNRAKWNRVLGK